jgi:hypothetical protein
MPEQLKEPQMNMIIVRPLIDRLYDPHNISVGMPSRLPHGQIVPGGCEEPLPSALVLILKELKLTGTSKCTVCS